jgi:hypothetical protein
MTGRRILNHSIVVEEEFSVWRIYDKHSIELNFMKAAVPKITLTDFRNVSKHDDSRTYWAINIISYFFVIDMPSVDFLTAIILTNHNSICHYYSNSDGESGYICNTKNIYCGTPAGQRFSPWCWLTHVPIVWTRLHWGEQFFKFFRWRSILNAAYLD